MMGLVRSKKIDFEQRERLEFNDCELYSLDIVGAGILVFRSQRVGRLEFV